MLSTSLLQRARMNCAWKARECIETLRVIFLRNFLNNLSWKLCFHTFFFKDHSFGHSSQELWYEISSLKVHRLFIAYDTNHLCWSINNFWMEFEFWLRFLKHLICLLRSHSFGLLEVYSKDYSKKIQVHLWGFVKRKLFEI